MFNSGEEVARSLWSSNGISLRSGEIASMVLMVGLATFLLHHFAVSRCVFNESLILLGRELG